MMIHIKAEGGTSMQGALWKVEMNKTPSMIFVCINNKQTKRMK